MSGAVLHAEAVRSLVTPAGENDPIVQALRKKQYFRTVRGLAAIRDALISESPDLASRTGFTEAFKLVSTIPANLQQQILGYPAVAFWVDVGLDLLRRRAHIKFPELHIEAHLESFGRAGIAAAMLSGESFVSRPRTDSCSRICLPGTGSYHIVSNAYPFEYVRLEAKSGELQVNPTRFRKTVRVVSKDLPKIAGFELNAVDEDLKLPGRYDFEFEQPFRDSDVIRWSSPVDQSLRWIAAANPLLSSEIRTGVRTIVPVYSKNPEVHISATFKEAPGLMALSWTPDTPVLAEALVHEYHHGKLNTLLAADPLILGPTGEALYYSPWRPDPRPLLGVLHGAFVFHAILDFWAKFLDAQIPLLYDVRLRQRICLVCRQTQVALKTLTAEAELSPCGSVLVQHLLERVNRFDDRFSADRVILQRVEQSMRSHREQWQKEHRHLDNGRPSQHLPSNVAFENGIAAGHLSIDKLACQFPADDPVIEDLTAANDERRLDLALNDWIRVSEEHSDARLEMLARAHAAYVSGAFEEAGARYGCLVQELPSSRYFWQCFAHCMRHIGEVSVGTSILTHLGELSSKACPEVPNMARALHERMAQAKAVLAAVDE